MDIEINEEREILDRENYNYYNLRRGRPQFRNCSIKMINK